MTNHWVDIKNANVILVMGGNPAEAHPCGFKWVTEAKAHNKARLVVVDPRFTRTAAVADLFVQIRPGTDIAFLGGVIKYLLDHDKIQHDYVKAYTNASFLVREDYAFEDGLFSGYDAEKRKYDKSTWSFLRNADGTPKTDPTLQDPSCVFQLLKKHYERYTPEVVSGITGTPVEKLLAVYEAYSATGVAGNALPNAPEHKANAWARYRLPGALRRMALAAGVVHVSERFVARSNSVRAPPYTRVDATTLVGLGSHLELALVAGRRQRRAAHPVGQV